MRYLIIISIVLLVGCQTTGVGRQTTQFPKSGDNLKGEMLIAPYPEMYSGWVKYSKTEKKHNALMWQHPERKSDDIFVVSSWPKKKKLAQIKQKLDSGGESCISRTSELIENSDLQAKAIMWRTFCDRGEVTVQK